jgi:putative endonuclease
LKSGLGAWGENKAAEYLGDHGYQILERNFRVWEGEIDLIAVKDEVIHFVEVKTRSSQRFGSPEESMHARKRSRLLRAGFCYLEQNFDENVSYQFDLVAIVCRPDQRVIRLTHYEDVIGMDALE